MGFSDSFREKYRVALLAARKDDTQGTINGLSGVCQLLKIQRGKDNGDSIMTKATLAKWEDIFGAYVQIIYKFGIKDRRVQKLFGLINDPDVPSFGDIIAGKDAAIISPDIRLPDSVPVEPFRGGEVPIDGLYSPTEEEPPKEDELPKGVAVPPLPVDKAPDEAVVPPSEELPIPIPDGYYPADSEPAEPDKPAEPVTDDQPVNPEESNEIKGVPMFNPESLRDFIGQQHIVKELLKEIAIAKNEGRKHLDNILLFGNPGLGKTTLMELIAKELGVKFELLDCSQFRNSQQSLKALQNFFMHIARDNEPVVIALDEIHMLNNELQSSLLTLLNNRVYVSPLDVNGQCKRIPIDEFTFIAATTDDDKVLDTIKNRCLRLKFQLVDYTEAELTQIYKNKVLAKGLTISDEAIATCVPRSRGAIRYVNSIVDGLNSALYNDNGVRMSTDITLEIALKYFEKKGIDAIGLEAKDREILQVIEEDTSGAISIEVLSARVGLDPKKYQSEYERYLIKIGFISVSGRGRSLTEKAINYLKSVK